MKQISHVKPKPTDPF